MSPFAEFQRSSELEIFTSLALLRVAYSGYCLYEQQFPPFEPLFPNEFSCSYNGSGEYFSSDFSSPYPASDLGDFFAPGITTYDGYITSFFGSSSWDWRDEHHNGEELPYEDCDNWIPGDDTHFSTCWEDYFPKFSDGFTGNSSLNTEQETGDFPRSEDQINVANMAGETTPAAPSYDDATSGYEYWLEQLWEEHTAQDQREDPRTYSDDRFCLNIFGYWPCMSQRDPGSLW